MKSLCLPTLSFPFPMHPMHIFRPAATQTSRWILHASLSLLMSTSRLSPSECITTQTTTTDSICPTICCNSLGLSLSVPLALLSTYTSHDPPRLVPPLVPLPLPRSLVNPPPTLVNQSTSP